MLASERSWLEMGFHGFRSHMHKTIAYMLKEKRTMDSSPFNKSEKEEPVKMTKTERGGRNTKLGKPFSS